MPFGWGMQCGNGSGRRDIGMRCVVCGAELADGALLCQQCGSVVRREDALRQNAAGGKMTKKEFFKLPGLKNCRTNILTCAIILYICAAATGALAFIDWEHSALSLLDAALLLGLGLWLQIGKSRVSAIIAAAYGVLNVVMTMIAAGRLQGWWIPLAGIWAIVYTFKIQKLWNQYQESGQLPEEAVSGK